MVRRKDPEVANSLDPHSATVDEGRTWIGWHGGDGDESWTRDTPYPGVPVRHNLPHHALQLEMARAGMD